jgi:hypothetical protein
MIQDYLQAGIQGRKAFGTTTEVQVEEGGGSEG